MNADLHVHTTYSDGTYSPEQIAKVAKKVGLNTVAITDHDTTAGLDAAFLAGKKYGVKIIPGIEFTTETTDLEVHILGYFIDYRNDEFQAVLAKLKNFRKDRVYKIVEKLKNLGVKIKAREVLRMAKNGSPGRPHVARVLVKAGICKNFREAFVKYLAYGGSAYVNHYKLLPQDAVKLIRAVKGIPVLAHPGGLSGKNAREKLRALVPELVTAGLLGIEVFYPTHRPEQIKFFTQWIKQYNLLITGGSDFHGESGVREVIFGAYALQDTYVDALKQKAGKLK